ncbi:MAG: carboxylating nicotinate-nucleotide diphosphorylase [Candidatus Thermoplasmatota archaeon]|nr:carboxylating nicotinate-nucleotide diphosphorylase [Candidatus Thermoplasmatota archaeon]
MMPLTDEEKNLLDMALEQDSGRGDLTSCVFDGEMGDAVIISEDDCILSGLEALEYVFERAGAEARLSEGALPGSICGKGAVIATVKGPVEALLRAERVALNTISRMSGIATLARKASDLADKTSPGTRVAGTRKTTPLFGILEKRALIDGGALPHRPDLSTMAMLKDNHIAALGGGPDAVLSGVEMLRERYGPYIKIEVEVEDIPSGMAAVDAGADIIMLDNLSPEDLMKASREVRRYAEEHGKSTILEASGGITMENLNLYAPYADIISMGSLTYAAPLVSFKMEYRSEP